MKRFACLVMVLLLTVPAGIAQGEGFWNSIGGWINQATEDASNWVNQAAEDTSNWVNQAAEDTSNWVNQAAEDTSNWVNQAWDDSSTWVVNAATDSWDWLCQSSDDVLGGVADFFDPPSTTDGTPSVYIEPTLPEGTLKMYLGYPVQRTGLDNGYHVDKEVEIGKDDPHFGMTVGKFYISGFSGVTIQDGDHFVFLKTVGDQVQLHFELVEDINMLSHDSFKTINHDVGGYDREFGVPPTDFGQGTLIVRFTDYQNKTGDPQIYTNFLAAKASGSANTVIDLNEEGDYEVALDYEIKKDSYVLGTTMTSSAYADYRIRFKFSVRNGNCMVFPFDLATGEELKNTAIAPNGFRLDLAYSRYLKINVKRSTLTHGAAGVTEDVRFNRPAKDGEEYSAEGIYTITVQNEYTGQETTKTIYVGSNQRLIDYVTQGYTLDQIIRELNK
ncbi:MAG: hypothetical protein IKP10_02150 [Clostridia bacterium]|nr:hypothetical protein [Clostridia bacterium]